MRQGLAKFSQNQQHLDAVLNELDIGKTGSVSYTEFLAGVINLRGRRPEEQDKLLWVAWQQFCPDAQGRVKTSSIQDAFAARGMTVADLPEDFLAALSTCGKEKSGILTFERFKDLLLRSDDSGQALRTLSGDSQRGGKLMRWIFRK